MLSLVIFKFIIKAISALTTQTHASFDLATHVAKKTYVPSYLSTLKIPPLPERSLYSGKQLHETHFNQRNSERRTPRGHGQWSKTIRLRHRSPLARTKKI